MWFLAVADSDHEWEKINRSEIDAIKEKLEEPNSDDDSLAKISVIPKPVKITVLHCVHHYLMSFCILQSVVPKSADDEPSISPLKRKRKLPGWISSLSKNAKPIPQSNKKQPKQTATAETKKGRSSQNSRSPKKTNSRSNSKLSSQRSTRSKKEEYSDDDEEVEMNSDDGDSYTGSSPSRRRQRRAAAVRVSSYGKTRARMKVLLLNFAQLIHF